MTQKQFTLSHRICALLAFLVSAVTYLLTIEPSASFWDCGEFIASSYKLEVGHPPGNPMFQLIARFFTLFGDNMHAAVLVNAMSALCSALTIFFLYLTIVWFAKRLIKPSQSGEYTLASAISVLGAGLVGSLSYCFSDTFWFSAVEGEVYAMSSLFTAVVFWAMTMWYDHADAPHADKWIVFIAFLMGLSIGVHLLNLLMIPALVFMYYYRKREDRPYSFWENCKIFLVGVLILALIYFIFIPLLPKLAAYVDLFFVNVLGLPYNSGAVFFLVALFALCFWGLFFTLKRKKLFWNTTLLCVTTILIGFSIFSVDIIRSCAKTPTNEYQPDNAFTLVRYLSREQYGKTPLVYGQYFDAPYDLKTESYWAPMDGKYIKADAPIDADYLPEGKMLFPRMWASSPDGRYEEVYESYMDGKGKKVAGSVHRKPTMGANLRYFFDYQLGWMYWRYFMWNFVGRQNQVHAPDPGDIFHGNWESGIKFIDNIRLGDQSNAPAPLKDDKGKNHYFFLPLLLGLLGLFFQFDRDKRGVWLNFLMFFMTGIAIVIYLNQPPYQVRERDYAYAGSFYFFSVWIGLGLSALCSWIGRRIKSEKSSTALNAALCLLCLGVPVLMAAQNWDDHDRSGRKTAVEMARNYLNSVGSNGILVTHGDNDTFPLWYAQEVENCRTDVRICNTSLLGTDWHIDQMKWAVNESAPLDLSVGPGQYLYGTNEMIPIVDLREEVMSISDVMTLFRHPQVKAPMSSGRKVDYIASRKISVPVNRENVIKSGILDSKYESQIPDSIILNISKDKDYITKPELFMLDLLSNYQWDRPICLLSMGGDLNIGIKEYFEYNGFSFQLVPIKNKTTSTQAGFVDSDELYRKMTEVYKWDALAEDDYFIDYQNEYTFLGVLSQRNLFTMCADVFIREGQKDRAIEMLSKCEQVMRRYPLETISLGFSGNDYMVVDMVNQYYALGLADKARETALALGDELLTTASFYLEFYDWGRNEFELAGNYIYLLSDALKNGGDEALGKELTDKFVDIVNSATGS
ncbi:MAG: protein O-mannosyl-transferase family [Candidatus Cryptobacteroides sp.]